MDIKTISYVSIFDNTKDVLYALNPDGIDASALLYSVTNESDPIAIYGDQTLFLARRSDIFVVLLARLGANDVFVKSAFDAFMECLDRVVRRWSLERIAEKYDQIVLHFNEFVFRGVILTDQSKELSSRVMKRSFENISGIKMKKGLASFINRATKSLRNN